MPLEAMPVGQPGCHPASPLSLANGAPETRGTTPDAVDLYGLVFSRGLPMHANEDIKIVWRMRGTGPLAATLSSPAGVATPLAWGPDRHSGSSYNRPGDEWGVGYRFDAPGCWHLHFGRSDTHGDVWLQIEP